MIRRKDKKYRSEIMGTYANVHNCAFGRYTCKGLFEIEKEGSIWTPDVTTSKQMKQLGRLTITQFETIEPAQLKLYSVGTIKCKHLDCNIGTVRFIFQ